MLRNAHKTTNMQSEIQRIEADLKKTEVGSDEYKALMKQLSAAKKDYKGQYMNRMYRPDHSKVNK